MKKLIAFVVLFILSLPAAAQTTTSLGLVEPAIGSTNWGTSMNTNLALINADLTQLDSDIPLGSSVSCARSSATGAYLDLNCLFNETSGITTLQSLQATSPTAIPTAAIMQLQPAGGLIVDSPSSFGYPSIGFPGDSATYMPAAGSNDAQFFNPITWVFGSFYSQGAALFNGSFLSAGSAVFVGTAQFDGTSTEVNSDTFTVNSTTQINADLTVSGTVIAYGEGTFYGNGLFYGSGTFYGDGLFDGDFTANGTGTFDGDGSFDGTLWTSGGITTNDDLVVVDTGSGFQATISPGTNGFTSSHQQNLPDEDGTFLLDADKGQSNGVATLDSTGHILLAQLPLSFNETPTGTRDGTNTVFSLANSPVGSVLLFKNGILQTLNTAYTLASNTVTFLTGFVPQPNDILSATYQY